MMEEPHKWDMHDKRQFLVALGRSPEINIQVISEKLPMKPIQEIRDMIKYYQHLANERRFSSNTEGVNFTNDELLQWIKLVEKTDPNSLKLQGVARALKYISLYEKRDENNDIDLGKIYRYLSQVCNEETTTELTERDSYFFMENLIKLAELTKSEDLSSLKEHLQQLQPENMAGSSNPLGITNELLDLYNRK